MQIVNLTPHPLSILVGGEPTTFPPSGVVARCKQSDQVVETRDGVDFIALQFGAVEFTDAEGKIIDFAVDANSIYIVSRIVADAKAYANFYAVAGIVYDENRKPLYAKGLSA